MRGIVVVWRLVVAVVGYELALVRQAREGKRERDLTARLCFGRPWSTLPELWRKATCFWRDHDWGESGGGMYGAMLFMSNGKRMQVCRRCGQERSWYVRP